MFGSVEAAMEVGFVVASWGCLESLFFPHNMPDEQSAVESPS